MWYKQDFARGEGEGIWTRWKNERRQFETTRRFRHRQENKSSFGVIGRVNRAALPRHVNFARCVWERRSLRGQPPSILTARSRGERKVIARSQFFQPSLFLFLFHRWCKPSENNLPKIPDPNPSWSRLINHNCANSGPEEPTNKSSSLVVELAAGGWFPMEFRWDSSLSLPLSFHQTK